MNSLSSSHYSCLSQVLGPRFEKFSPPKEVGLSCNSLMKMYVISYINVPADIYLFKVISVDANDVVTASLLLTSKHLTHCSGVSMVVFDQVIAGLGRIFMTWHLRRFYDFGEVLRRLTINCSEQFFC